MKYLSITFVLAILCITCVPVYAQSGVTGTWQSTSQGATLMFALRVDGPRLTGVIRGCAGNPIEISEGKIDGDTITFKCNSPNGQNIRTFMGKINGDEIAFTSESQLRNLDGAWRTSSEPQFTAKRVPDATDSFLADTADRVKGVEIAAAVNLIKQDTKVVGHLFLAQSVGRVKAVIVVIHTGVSGSVYGDLQIRRLAERTEAGLLYADFSNIAPGARTSIDGDGNLGGGDGLLMLLQRLAQESGHQEVKDAPLLFWGHSAAGPFGPTFASVHPDRTIAFVGYHSGGSGGGGARWADIKVFSQIPALHLAGGKDGPANEIQMRELWKRGRTIGAPWTFAVNPDAAHSDGLEKAEALLIPWITAVIRQRVSPNGPTLRPVTDGSGWMGNNETGEVAPYGTFTGSKPEASWLPDETSARGWQEVIGKAK